ncbi:Ubiquitinyl hydrolase 1 [Purpureocillium takamizusanense]|uniref:ubiquitinyl hydrolase 1 n=1 Tax=Purpureocillium takamizusanense TaxID=2060973 RepID=A0A9Q8QEG4_9HYPO|nr:Ubiquitinyl hydrolase 1 [Purpureocillium takamizusanense]UNI17459.1 Ubiquitinyl hydrolase 1 [Purpureocillium takamizusanense]
MTARYDLRGQDQDTGSYAALPGTAQTEFVQHNMTPMKSRLTPGKEVGGCHPSRWVYELTNNDFTFCDLFNRARSAGLETPYAWDHPHKLVINGNQSFATSSTRVLSAICLDCHFHFVFKMVWDIAHVDSLCHSSQSRWPLRDNDFPWHHLTWAGSSSDVEVTSDHNKYQPLLAREYFVCSAPPCTFQMTLEISMPRMGTWWLKLLMDRGAVREQLRVAKEHEPSRYEGATDEWATQAPLNLNTYLKNLLESTPEDVRSISKRNKRFAVLFGPRCFSIFRHLEFTEQVVERDGMDEGSFTPIAPAPSGGPSGTTEIGTYRAYLEDVRAEVQCLIHKAGQAAEKPTYCAPVLHQDLQCAEVPNVQGSALVNLDRYRLLGILPGQSREVIVNAYKRQWELLSSRRRALVDGLTAVANDTGDEMLSDYAMTQSSVFESQLQRQGTSDEDGVLTQALEFLGLQPPNNYSADSIIEAFRQKLAKDPAEAVNARSMLMIIARASNDDMYQASLLMESDAKMSLDTARAILGLGTSDVPWQTAAEAAKKKLEDSKSSEEKEVLLDALEAVADHTNSPTLKQAVLEMRNSSGIMNYGGSSKEPADLSLPVGLHNIGNTCYLNSLLQYLFTVKPIRDVVLNYDQLRLDLTDESIKSRLLGGNKMQMDRGEAVVAQACELQRARSCFDCLHVLVAQELATLFQNLQSSDQAATRPSQRLANAVLLSTHTLLHSDKSTTKTEVGTQPPPLPARPSPAAPASKASDVDMVTCTVKAVPDATETASISSSRTLVDQEDARSDRSFERVQPVAAAEESRHAGDTVAVTVSEDVHMVDDSEQAEEQPRQVSQQDGDTPAPNSDIVMVDASEPETVDQKVLNALEHQSRSSGTDQQDVEEVMGSIINRLQAAIRPSSIDAKTGIQLEKIMETFFVTTVNYTKKFDDKSYQHEISFDRSITAFPAPDGPCSLYDALGRNFDQQILEESKLSRYTAIKTLPPVLHVLIQRTQSTGRKNGNPVVIPETLYLDRYMDAPHDSPTFRRRVEDWAITDRIADLRTQIEGIDANPTYLNFLNSIVNGEDAVKGDAVSEKENIKEDVHVAKPEETWDFDGPVEDGFLLVSPTNAHSTEPPAATAQKEQVAPFDARATDGALRQMMESELAHLEKMLAKRLDSMRSIPYRLHAVICHRGQLMSGHYWVWICDFEERVWRFYNDESVQENRDTADVLHKLSTSGEPYYLCYVRDQDKEEYVDVPKRHVQTPTSVEEDTPQSGLAATDRDGDVDINGAEKALEQEDGEIERPTSPKYRIE